MEEETFYIGVDLDGTLAFFDGWKGNDHIGQPIPLMLERVKKWLNDGKAVKCFTARAANPENIPYVREWLDKYGLHSLDITCIKDQYMTEFWDDRAIQVKPNTGIPITEFLDKDKIISESILRGTNMKYYVEYLKEEISPERARELYNIGRSVATSAHQSVSKLLSPNDIAAIRKVISEKVLRRRQLLANYKTLTPSQKEEVKNLERIIASGAKKLKEHERESHVTKMVNSITRRNQKV